MIKEDNKIKKNRTMQIIVCITLALTVIFAIVTGAVFIIREANSYVKYGGIYLGRGEVNYFASRYKDAYINELTSDGVGVYDDALFWNYETDESGKTYGELLSEKTKMYIAEIVYAADVFDKKASLSTSQLSYINTIINDRLNSVAEGSVHTFNSLVSVYGFDFESMKNALTVEYKAALARAALYGSDGSYVAKAHPEAVEEYLERYSHVKLLFIDTASYSGVALNEKNAVIEDIRRLIYNYNNNLDNSMTPYAFDIYLNAHNDGDDTYNADGCYFKDGTSFTESFRDSYPTVLEKALGMEKGYDELVYESGVCFIYKYDVSASSLLTTGNADTLSDFYYQLSVYLFDNELVENWQSVIFTEKYGMLDLVNIKKNVIYGVNLK